MNELTQEQQNILAVARDTNDHIVVEALAGTGKTTTLLALLEALSAPSTLLLAFNKRIADELQEKVPPMPRGRMVLVKTIHAIGLKVLRDNFWGLDVDDECHEELITGAVTELSLAGQLAGFPMPARRAAARLLTVLKDTQTEPELTAEAIIDVGNEYNSFDKLDNQALVNDVVQVTAGAYRASLNFRGRRKIAYADMVWGAVVSKINVKSRYKCVIVDEAQDVSLPQLMLIEKLLAPDGRLIIAGDIWQAIYGWRGAAGVALWKKMREHYKARFMPLTTTWRCSQAVVKEANALVPKLRARPGAPAGAVRHIDFDKLAKELRECFEFTYVLSRNNQALLTTALELWKHSVKFTLNAASELIEPLFTVLGKLSKTSPKAYLASLDTWFATEIKRAESAQSSAWADRAEGIDGMLRIALDYAGSPGRVEQLLSDILSRNQAYSKHRAPIVLSTVHKVKGLEAKYVYLIKQTFERHKPRRPGAPPKKPDQEEDNILYVAITRAKDTLTWVSIESMMQKIYRWNVEAEGENICSVAPTLDGRVAIGTSDGDSIALPATHPVAQAAIAENFTDFEIALDAIEGEGFDEP